MTKISVLSRWLNLPAFRWLVRRLFIPCHFFHFAKMIEANIVFAHIDSQPRGKVCDIACGCGEYCFQLAGQGYQVCGIDLDERAINLAAAISGQKANFLVADAAKLPFATEVFDTLVSLGSLEHFHNDDQAIKEMQRVLRPQGRLILTVDSFTYPGIKKQLQHQHQARHKVINFYTLSSLSQKLERYGLQVQKANYYINSPVSAFFYELSIRNIWLSMLLFPLSYPLAMLSDKLLGNQQGGYYLLAIARKGERSPVVQC